MTTRTSFALPEKLKREARAKAALEGIALAEVVRRFLKAWIDGRAALPEDPDQEEPAQD